MTERPRKQRPAARLPRRARQRLSRLKRRPEIRALARLARRDGMRVWIVGGALRDLLIGRPLSEVDVAVTGDAEKLAQQMEAAALGTVVPLSKVAPRVFRVAGQREIDIAELTGGSIEADLARRDFTVNAIAWELTSRLPQDPFGGIRDLARRRLRLISERNLAEDPLRVLRAARLAATLKLAPDRAVAAASRRAAPGLAAVAPERARVELVKLLESERAVGALRWLRSVGALAPALGIAPATTRGRRLNAFLLRLDAASVRKASPASRRRLRLSVIAAGLGMSSREAARWLAARRFSRAEAAEVAHLLELTRAALAVRAARQGWAWIRDSGERRADAVRLLTLLFPDRRGLARRLGSRPVGRSVRVTGEDVMRWLGISGGPRVGALLREIEIEALRGAVASRQQAKKWLQNGAIGWPEVD